MKASARHFYSFFKAAAGNQAAFDIFYYDFFETHAESYSFLPRPAQWLNKSTLLLRFLRVGAPFIWFLWCVFGGGYFFVKLLLLKTGSEKIKTHKLLNKAVALAVCKRSVDVIVQAEVGRDVLFLKVPGAKDVNSCSGAVSAVSVLSFWELFKCFFLAVNIHYRLAYNGRRAEVFQSYAALDWLIVFFALIKINPDQLIIAEHHDRWAVLADSYCGPEFHSGSQLELILVQHGLEFPNTYERMVSLGFEVGLPYKLRRVGKCYVYNEVQREVFREKIISACALSSVQFDFYSYRLPLVSTGLPGFSILVVGNVRCEDFHYELYLRLSGRLACSWFYKPHPALRSSAKIFSAGWDFIDDKDYYPSVSLVVSYPSTLVDEYKACGIKVYEHEFGVGIKDVDSAICDVLDLIGRDGYHET